jgi:Lrp/AsnC family leucine-responsive transcriptional regulator
MDTTDRKLLNLLRSDSRTKYSDLGASVHLSSPATFERVRKLEKSGIIKNFSVELDPTKLGLLLCAFVNIRLQCGTGCQSVVSAISDYREIEECHSIAGTDCILIKVRVPDTTALDALLQRIRVVAGVERTLTTVVLNTYFERGIQTQ